MLLEDGPACGVPEAGAPPGGTGRPGRDERIRRGRAAACAGRPQSPRPGARLASRRTKSAWRWTQAFSELRSRWVRTPDRAMPVSSAARLGPPPSKIRKGAVAPGMNATGPDRRAGTMASRG